MSYFGLNASDSKQVKQRKEAYECSFPGSADMLRIHFRFISSHLSDLVTNWAPQCNDLICSDRLAGRGIGLWASSRCHGVGLDLSLSISGYPGRGLLPEVTDSALTLQGAELASHKQRGDVCGECRDTPFKPPRRWLPSCSSPKLSSAGLGCYPAPGYGVVSCSEGNAGILWVR